MKRHQRGVWRPLEVGTRVLVARADGQAEGKVMELRHPDVQTNGLKTSYEYYIHYLRLDARLDEWLSADQLEVDLVEEPEGPDLAGDSTRKRTRSNWSPGGSSPSNIMCTPPRSQCPSQVPKNIQTVHFGSSYVCDAWYFSPFPEESVDKVKEAVHLCEFCLAAYKSKKTLSIHTCGSTRPPGKEIYRDTVRGSKTLVMFEINGAGAQKEYCKRLSVVGKLFLEHKSVCYDIETFSFFVLCEEDTRGAHIVGYFSKEKRSKKGYNVACIVVFPQYQKLGYGKLLLSVSYEISKREGNFNASPEKPLSDLAQMCYRRYWSYVLLKAIYSETDNEKPFSLASITRSSGIRTIDLRDTLHLLLDEVEFQFEPSSQGAPAQEGPGLGPGLGLSPGTSAVPVMASIRLKPYCLESLKCNLGNIILCDPQRLKWKGR